MFKEKFDNAFDGLVEKFKLNFISRVNSALYTYFSKFGKTIERFNNLISGRRVLCYSFAAVGGEPCLCLDGDGNFLVSMGILYTLFSALDSKPDLFVSHVVSDLRLLYYFYNNEQNKTKLQSLISKIDNEIKYIDSVVCGKPYKGLNRAPDKQRNKEDFYFGYKRNKLMDQETLIELMKNILDVAHSSSVDNYSNYKECVTNYFKHIGNVLPEDTKESFEKLLEKMNEFEEFVIYPTTRTGAFVLKKIGLFDLINYLYLELFSCKKSDIRNLQGKYFKIEGLNFDETNKTGK